MAGRPVFVPSVVGTQLVQEVQVRFLCIRARALPKKEKCSRTAPRPQRHGLSPLLEISSKSDLAVGQKLSAFHLKIEAEGEMTTVECAFQGSKVFELGGPFPDLFLKTSKEAKQDPRLRESGRLIGFKFEGKSFPTTPMTLFYDWLYFKALYQHRDWIARREEWAGFTDIEFNPERSINCQARSFAAFISLIKRHRLEKAMSSFRIIQDPDGNCFHLMRGGRLA